MASHPPLVPDEEEAGCFPFSGAAGRGVRVAVIDSGVNPRHPHIARVAGGVCVQADGTIKEGDYIDRLGHGTAVMAAIQEKAPAADYFAVKVFETALRTKAVNLLAALDWCIEQEMDVVNLSLGTTNQAHAEGFARAVANAEETGTLLVAAREIEGQLCYPGCLPGVFSVGLDWSCPRNCFRCEHQRDGTVYYASGYPRSAPGVPRSRNVQGISFAVANMTGFVVRACEVQGRQERGLIRAALSATAARLLSKTR